MNVSWMEPLGDAATHWLGTLGWAGVEGGAFILFAWAACRLLRQLSPAARCWLWWLACLKLVLGLVWIWSIPLRVLPASPQPAGMSARFDGGPDPGSRGRGGGYPAGSAASRAAQAGGTEGGVERAPRRSSLLLLFGLWAGGAALLLSLGAWQETVLRRLIARSRPLDASPAGEAARRLGAEMGLAAPVRVVESGEVTSPLVYGLLRPVLVLPLAFRETLDPEELRMVLAHELAHVRRRDLWLALLPTVARALFFFFPPAWLAFREWATAREVACDREAIGITGTPSTRYAEVLLKVVSGDHALEPLKVAAALGATASFHTLRARLLLLKAPAPSGSVSWPAVLWAGGCALLLVLPWRLAPEEKPGIASPPPNAVPWASKEMPADIADVAAREFTAAGDVRKRYFLVGPQPGVEPPDPGYRLLVTLPGGDGSAEFQPFIRRIRKFALPEGYLVAQPVAVAWSREQFERVVWPTRSNPWPGMRFSTEEFVEAVVRDVARRYPVDRRYIFALGWSSGGPPVYALSLAKEKSVTGTFAAMSIFSADWLPPLRDAAGHPFFVLHSPQDRMVPINVAKQASAALREHGARTQLETYAGGHGWRAPVYQNLRRGIRWLEEHHAEPASL